MKIEIKKISIPNAFDATSYPCPGFYHVNDSLMVLDETGFVWSVGSIKNYSFLNETKDTNESYLLDSISSVSESFALKMLAIATRNNDAIKEL